MMRYSDHMRTTVDLDPDVAHEIAKLRARTNLGLSAAVNELIRAGIRSTTPEYTYVHRSRPMGALVDLSNVGEVLDLLDQSATEGRSRAS
jgi:hypothetical protein